MSIVHYQPCQAAEVIVIVIVIVMVIVVIIKGNETDRKSE